MLATKRRWGAALLLLILGPGGALLAGRAGAESDVEPFVATSSAAGVRVGYVVPGFVVVEEFVDAGGPVAQTRLDTASADSYAAFPHPGGTVLAYQGLAALAGVNSPFGYPFFVSATHPASPEQSLSDPSGAYQLKAKAAAEAAEATAAASGAQGDVALSTSRADTSTVREGGKITARASSIAEGLRIGKVLRIGSVRSSAVSVKMAGEAEPKTETQLGIDGLRVGDQPFGFGPDGFTIGGTPLPIPPAEANKVANQILAPAGVTVRFIQATPTAGGAVAPILEITAPHKLPVPGEPTGTLVLRLGGAAASVTNAEAAPTVPVSETVGEAPLPARTGSSEPAPVPTTTPGTAAADTAPFTPLAPLAPSGRPGPSSLFSAGGAAAGADLAAPAGADTLAAPSPVGAARSGATVIRATRVTGIRAAYGAAFVALLAALIGAYSWLRGGMKAWLAS